MLAEHTTPTTTDTSRTATGPNTVWAALNTLRAASNESVSALAARLGISSNTLGSHFTGRRESTTTDAIVTAAALDARLEVVPDDHLVVPDVRSRAADSVWASWVVTLPGGETVTDLAEAAARAITAAVPGARLRQRVHSFTDVEVPA